MLRAPHLVRRRSSPWTASAQKSAMAYFFFKLLLRRHAWEKSRLANGNPESDFPAEASDGEHQKAIALMCASSFVGVLKAPPCVSSSAGAQEPSVISTHPSRP